MDGMLFDTAEHLTAEEAHAKRVDALSDAAKAVLHVISRYDWSLDELRHDALWSTQGTNWELSSSDVDAALNELVEAEVTGNVKGQIRRIDG